MTRSVTLDARAELPTLLEPVPVGRRRGATWLARHPAWPLTLLLAGIPLWWALGFGEYMFILLAIPMAARLYAWSAQGNRAIRVPPGFGLWLLFLLCVLASVATLHETAPGTLVSPVSNRIISYSVRGAGYLAVTVILLFAGNLTERELSRQRLAWLLGLVAVYTSVGGLAGIVAPNFSFTSPLAAIVPGRLSSNNLVLQAQLHPALSQIQSILGQPRGRPDAPFAYTNNWGNALAILLPWLVVGWWLLGTRRQRLIAAVTLTIVIVPVVYSLNRGLWIGLIVALCYAALRLAARGKLAVLGALLAGLAVAVVVVSATPLQSIINQRLSTTGSVDRRGSLAVDAVNAAVAAPLIGYGDTRHPQGSIQSVTVGRSASCPACGGGTIGANGQLWLLLICDGFLGTALYLAFFAYGIWRYRRDRTAYGMASVLVLVLSFVFMIAYDAAGAPLAITMLAYAMLWRNERAMHQSQIRAAQDADASAPMTALPPRRAGG
jgi:hypothetical protein